MAYCLTTEPENAAPAKSIARPKTHTPLLQVKDLGLRFYSPNLGRWLNRDPIGQKGGLHLYGFVRNAPLLAVDSDGRGLCRWVRDGIRWVWKCLIWPSPNPVPIPYPIPNPIPIPTPDPWDPGQIGPDPSRYKRLANCSLTMTRDWCVGLAGSFECRYTCEVWYKPWPNGEPYRSGTEQKTVSYGCCPKPTGCPPMPDEEWRIDW